MMKPGLRGFLVADPEPTRRPKPVRQNKARVKGLSAACRKKQHYKCTSLSCTCIHHQNEHRKDLK